MDSRDFDKIFDKYGSKIVNTLQRELRVQKFVASGRTVDSIYHKTKDGGKGLEIWGSGSLDLLDKGLSSGQSRPSSVEILQWMRDRNIRPINFKRRGNTMFAASSNRNMKSSAYLIARKIRTKGTIKRLNYNGANILSYVDGESDLQRELMEELGKEVMTTINFELLKVRDIERRNI